MTDDKSGLGGNIQSGNASFSNGIISSIFNAVHRQGARSFKAGVFVLILVLVRTLTTGNEGRNSVRLFLFADHLFWKDINSKARRVLVLKDHPFPLFIGCRRAPFLNTETFFGMKRQKGLLLIAD